MAWFENSQNQRRLQQVEIPLMKRNFPHFALYSNGVNGSQSIMKQDTLFWGGKLGTNFGTTYTLAVAYPENYPYGQLHAFVVELLSVKTPHKYIDGHLCLYSNDHGGGGEGIGRETTAVTVVGWTAAWLNAWEVYQRTQRWPGR